MPDAGAVWVDVLPDLKKFGPRLRAELKTHADGGMDIPLGLDTAAAKTELEAFRRQVDEVAGRTAAVKVSANTRAALAGLVGVEKAADRLDGRVINMQFKTTGSPVVPPAAAPSGGGGTPTGGGGGRKGGYQQPFTDMSPAGAAAVWTLIPPLVPAVGALAGGLGAVTSGLAAATAGAAMFALAAIPAIKETTAATGDLTRQQEIFRDSLGGLNAAWKQFRAQTDGPVLVAAAQGVDAAQVGLARLTPATQRSAHALADLADEARAAMDGPRWSGFFSFVSRQATPSLLVFGRSLGNLTTGITGLAMSMEPLWNEVGPGLEDLTARFAAWGHEGENFTGFIQWTLENGPTFVDTFGAISSAAIDVGTALGPLGVVYAEGLTVLAGAISAVAEHAPLLIQLAVAAKTAQIALDLLGRANTGLIQPLKELPGRISEFGSKLRESASSADTAAGASGRFGGALGGVVGVLGGPWGIAMGVALGLGAGWISQKQKMKAAEEDWAAALRSSGGAIDDDIRLKAAQQLESAGALEAAERAGVSAEKLVSALVEEGEVRRDLATIHETLTSHLYESADAADQAGSATQRLNEAIAGIYGPGVEYKDLTAEQVSALEEMFTAQEDVTAGFSGAVEANRLIADATGETTQAQQGLNAELAEGALQARDLKTALDALTGVNITAAEAEIRFEEALHAANEAASTNSETLDVSTEAGRSNRTALIELAEATHNQTEAMDANGASAIELTQHQEQARKKFVEIALQMGATTREAEDLADEWLGMPSEVNTAVEVSASGRWKAYSADTGMATPSAGGRNSFYAEGGHVLGPGTATSDSIPAWLSDGEYVEPTHVVDHYGVGFFEALRQKRIPKSALPGFAEGGWVSTGSGVEPWEVVDDHRRDVRADYSKLVRILIGRIGDTMAQEWKSLTAGPMGVVRLAEASIGRYPEAGGNNTNAITNWFGMNGAPWCAMFISWLFAQTGASRALGGAARTAWTGDYYNSGMERVSTPQPGDIAVYGTRHVNLVASPGGGRRIGGNQSNNVTAAPYSGGAIFRPMWDRVGFAAGGHVSLTDILSQDQGEDQRAGLHPLLRGVHQIMGLADGGLASGWTVVGEEGPELARFDDPARIYSHQESTRMLASASRVGASGGPIPSQAAPLVGSQSFHLHSAEATVRDMAEEMTHSLKVARKGGRYADG